MRRKSFRPPVTVPTGNRFAGGIVSEIKAGLCLGAGIGPSGDEFFFESARERFGGSGLDLFQASGEILNVLGLPDPGSKPGRIRAAFSSATGTELLENVVNTAFMDGFQASPDTTAWCVGKQISNFLPNRRLRLSISEKLLRLPRGQEADHVTLGLVGAEEYSVSRFARQIVLDEQELTGGELAEILEPFTVLGRAAGSLRTDLVYSVLLSNASLADGVALFHSTHANLNTSSALAVDKLDTGLRLMREQTENSHPVDTVPSHLIVPPALEGLARRLVRDMETTRNDQGLHVVVEPRLGLGVVDPMSGTTATGSNTTWYLAGTGPTIEFGARTPEPEIRSFTLDRKGRWGRGWAINWDVGAKALDYRALSKNTA